MNTRNLPEGKGRPVGAYDWRPHLHVWDDKKKLNSVAVVRKRTIPTRKCGTSMSQNPMGLHSLLQGWLYLFYLSNVLKQTCSQFYVLFFIIFPEYRYSYIIKDQKGRDCMRVSFLLVGYLTTVSVSQTYRTIDELRKICKELVEAHSKYYPSICSEGQRETTINLNQDGWCLSRDSNRIPPEIQVYRFNLITVLDTYLAYTELSLLFSNSNILFNL
jgi:hypothetical protein